MNQDLWQKVKGLFEVAVELPPNKRKILLDHACQNDDDLRREVESLLSSDQPAERFMEKPPAEALARPVSESDTIAAGNVFGHYKIMKQIGIGGMGRVYLAQDQMLDRKVAIKFLSDIFSRRESYIERFLQEAKAASALNHPNILVIHEIGTSEKVNFIVSEYIEGETLRAVIQRAPLKFPDVLEISIQIASALSVAHAAHIIHRDIKPENIMIRPDGYVKILDFGLAKLIEQKAVTFEAPTCIQNETVKGVILGTINYMSPEQATGEKVDGRTDIFSLGVLIYEMIAGSTPFARDSTSETFANLLNAEPPPLSRYSASVPDELQQMVSKMLRKNKNERFQTTKDLLADLKSLREKLALEEKSGKSSSTVGDHTTAALQAATGDVNNRANKTSYHLAERFRQNKFLAALSLAALLIGAVGGGYYFWSVSKTASNVKSKQTLAVLPFINAGQDANTEYLSDGITESIINNMSQVSGIRVMSRNSTFRFKNNQTDTKIIASKLEVHTLVTGDVKQIGDKLIINVRLINASDDSQIWGHQYVITTSDVIVSQNEIARAVANNLRLKLTHSDQQRFGKNYTENVEAYQLYLQGRFHLLKLKRSESQKAVSYFHQAIALDPKYALAYVGLAGAYRALALTGEMPATEFLPKAKAAAQKAIELDETLAEAHAELGFIIMRYDWNWKEAERQCQRALELDPNNAEGHHTYAQIAAVTGRHQEALAEIKRARELDPLNLRISSLEAQFLIFAGKADEALFKLQKVFELEPDFWFAHYWAASAYIAKGMYSEAIAEARRARDFSDESTQSASLLGYALAKSGKTAEARSEVEALIKLSNRRYVPPYHIALIYHGLDERDETLAWLEHAVEQRDSRLIFLKVEQKWDNLRTNPRFQATLRRIGFEQ